MSGPSTAGDRERAYVLLGVLASIAILGIVLSPMLGSGFMGDDQMNSATFARSSLDHSGMELFEQVTKIQIETVVGVGRIFPLSTYIVIPFYWADGDPSGFKVYILLLVLLDVALFGYLVWRLSGSGIISVAATATLPLLVQFRSVRFHDPVLGFGGHLEILVALLFVSLIAFVAYLDGRKRAPLAISILIFCATLLFYEITLVLPLLYLLVALFHRASGGLADSIRRSWPFFAAAVVMVVLTLGVRFYLGTAITTNASSFDQIVASGADPTQGAYGLSLAPGPVLETLAKQVFATIPLSYSMLTPSLTDTSLAGDLMRSAVINTRASVAIFLGYALIAWLMFRISSNDGIGDRTRTNWALVSWVGAGLLVLPNVLISLSPRYQGEVFWGVGYLPLYVAYFGTALLIAVLLGRAVDRLQRRDPRLVAIFLAVAVLAAGTSVSMVNLRNAGAEVEVSNRGTWYAREVLETATDEGLFSSLPRGTTLVVSTARPWDTPVYFAGLTKGRVIAVRTIDEWVTGKTNADPAVATAPAGSDVYLLSYSATWRDNGSVILGRLSSTAGTAGDLKVTEPYIFIEAAPLETSDPGAQGGIQEVAPNALGFRDSDFQVVVIGNEWGLFKGLGGTEQLIETGTE